jgi:hypothetical protein
LAANPDLTVFSEARPGVTKLCISKDKIYIYISIMNWHPRFDCDV